MKVETAKLKECEETKDCINQKSLLKELKESIEGVNATMESLPSKTTKTPTRETGGWKASFVNKYGSNLSLYYRIKEIKKLDIKRARQTN